MENNKENMTEKELKKLSRLELLEILLEESKENERLREMLDKSEKEAPDFSENGLSQTVQQLNGALNEMNRLVYELRHMKRENVVVENVSLAPVKKVSSVRQSYPTPPEKPAEVPRNQVPEMDENTKNAIISDRKLYWHLMRFYSQNEMALAFLPPEIQEDVRARLRGIINAGK